MILFDFFFFCSKNTSSERTWPVSKPHSWDRMTRWVCAQGSPSVRLRAPDRVRRQSDVNRARRSQHSLLCGSGEPPQTVEELNTSRDNWKERSRCRDWGRAWPWSPGVTCLTIRCGQSAASVSGVSGWRGCDLQTGRRWVLTYTPLAKSSCWEWWGVTFTFTSSHSADTSHPKPLT